MRIQYITFGQSHTHPETGKPLKNHVVKVVAPSEHLCRAAAFAKYGPKFSRLTDNWSETYYPYGVYETLIVSVDSYKGETAPELVPESDRLIKQHFSEIHEEPEEPEPDITPGESQGGARNKDGSPYQGKSGGTAGEQDRDNLKPN